MLGRQPHDPGVAFAEEPADVVVRWRDLQRLAVGLHARPDARLVDALDGPRICPRSCGPRPSRRRPRPATVRPFRTGRVLGANGVPAPPGPHTLEGRSPMPPNPPVRIPAANRPSVPDTMSPPSISSEVRVKISPRPMPIRNNGQYDHHRTRMEGSSEAGLDRQRDAARDDEEHAPAGEVPMDTHAGTIPAATSRVPRRIPDDGPVLASPRRLGSDPVASREDTHAPERVADARASQGLDDPQGPRRHRAGPRIALGAEADPSCWVVWGDDPAVRYAISCRPTPGLLQVLARVNVPRRGPARFGEGDPLEPACSWASSRLEMAGGHRLLGFQVESHVLRGADDEGDAMASFALELFARVDGRPFTPRAAKRGGAAKAGAARRDRGQPATPQARPPRKSARRSRARRSPRPASARHGGNALRTAELLRPPVAPSPDKRPLHPFRRTLRYWASRLVAGAVTRAWLGSRCEGFDRLPNGPGDLLLQPPVVVGSVRADGHPPDAAAPVVLRPQGGGHGRRRSQPAHGTGPGRRSRTSPARTTCSRRPARSAP